MIRRILKISFYVFVILVVAIYVFPLIWIVLTSLKLRIQTFTYPPLFLFRPTLKNFALIFTAGVKGIALAKFPERLINSIIIASGSTGLAVVLGTMAAYGFSRLKIPGGRNLLFFILSTRFLPPIVIVIPIFLMYKTLSLYDTHLGLILLYTSFNLSFATWMMKGFMDEIPKEYEEAALVDGCTRMKAFSLIVIPEATTGMIATAIFSFIIAWNEFLFALVLTTDKAKTAPPAIVYIKGPAGVGWGEMAVGVVLLLIPVFFFTFIVRKYLIRGISFGTIKG